MGIFHRPRPVTLSDTSNTVLRLERDANSVLLWSIVFLTSIFFSLSFPSEIESRISLAERRERARNQTLHSEAKRGRGKLEGEKLRSFMSFFVKKCEGGVYGACFHEEDLSRSFI